MGKLLLQLEVAMNVPLGTVLLGPGELPRWKSNLYMAERWFPIIWPKSAYMVLLI